MLPIDKRRKQTLYVEKWGKRKREFLLKIVSSPVLMSLDSKKICTCLYFYPVIDGRCGIPTPSELRGYFPKTICPTHADFRQTLMEDAKLVHESFPKYSSFYHTVGHAK